MAGPDNGAYRTKSPSSQCEKIRLDHYWVRQIVQFISIDYDFRLGVKLSHWKTTGVSNSKTPQECTDVFLLERLRWKVTPATV